MEISKNNIEKAGMGAVISLSGGMDSTCLLVNLLADGRYKQIIAMSFDYGQKHKIELERAEANIKYLNGHGFNIIHHIVDLKSAMANLGSALTEDDIEVPEGHYEEDQMRSTVVPNRNAIFSSIVFAKALAMSAQMDIDVDICLGIHAGDHEIYPDCRQEFRDAIEHAFKVGNWGSERVNYYTPYLHGNKTSILEDCLLNCERIDVDFNIILKNTNTSYNPTPDGKSSGTSGADIERIEAFIAIGRKDPVEYAGGWENAKAHAEEVLGISGNHVGKS